MTEYNKLVRDKIPEIIEASDTRAEIRIITDDQEFLSAICKKVVEEANELQENPCLEELADVQTVLDAAARRLGYSRRQVDEACVIKGEERGFFEDRIFLIRTDDNTTA